MFSFGLDFSRQNQESQGQSQTNQSSSGVSTNRGTQSGSQESTRSIAGAGAQETELVSQILQSLYGNLQSAQGLVQGGYQDAMNTAVADYNRVIEEGSKSALGIMSKSGMNSSLVNNLVGNVTKSAAGPLANVLVGLQSTMPMQSINAVNSVASPLMSMLQGYFLNERGQNVTQTGSSSMSQTGTSTSSQTGSSSSTQSGTTQGTSTGFNFGMQR